jgi:hypothetical protein
MSLDVLSEWSEDQSTTLQLQGKRVDINSGMFIGLAAIFLLKA